MTGTKCPKKIHTHPLEDLQQNGPGLPTELEGLDQNWDPVSAKLCPTCELYVELARMCACHGLCLLCCRDATQEAR
ncbi:MAG: hypothetical protein KAJ19_21690 [Gammaproteobacteria bacterium]|nr:hypothetical protein [Gammaproteobacteria bacterium]